MYKRFIILIGTNGKYKAEIGTELGGLFMLRLQPLSYKCKSMHDLNNIIAEQHGLKNAVANIKKAMLRYKELIDYKKVTKLEELVGSAPKETQIKSLT